MRVGFDTCLSFRKALKALCCLAAAGADGPFRADFRLVVATSKIEALGLAEHPRRQAHDDLKAPATGHTSFACAPYIHWPAWRT